MNFFNRTLEIKGKHADMIRKLTNADALNCDNIEIFIICISIGINRGLKAEIDPDSKSTNVKILSEQMVNHSDEIDFFYKLLMLSDSKYCPSSEERCNKAFRYIGTELGQKDENHFIKTMLGGLEFLYEQIMENTSSRNDIFNNICDFVETFE